MNRNFAQTNVPLVALILFFVIYGFVAMAQPAFLYKKNNTLREFGVGYRNKTILPMWLFSFLLGVICYLIVIYYLEYQQHI